MLEKIKNAFSTAVSKVKDAVSKVKLPQSTADVEWKDGQPVFKPKTAKPKPKAKTKKKE